MRAQLQNLREELPPVRRLPQIALVLIPLVFAAGCGDDGPRYEGMPEHVKKRHLGLEGAPNFRDLGGYETSDGRSVRWGLFYRSAHLGDLTDRDLEIVSELGIRLVCDFRSPDEKAEDPDRLPAVNPPKVAELEIWDASFSAEAFKERFADGEVKSEEITQLLIEGNRLFATKFSPLYRELFARILDPQNLPVVVHCTAGKDRAGFASALILRVLGVPLETIYDDYLLTNFYTAAKIDRMVMLVRAATFFRVDEAPLRAVMGVERRFLDAAFAAIEKNYGSFGRYRREALGIGDAELEAFRDRSLEGS